LPFTIPVEPIVAMAVLLLLHVPPVTASARVIEANLQTVVVPVMVPAEAVAVTVTTNVAVALPQLLLTV
jgi:hypothetical protein